VKRRAGFSAVLFWQRNRTSATVRLQERSPLYLCTTNLLPEFHRSRVTGPGSSFGIRRSDKELVNGKSAESACFESNHPTALLRMTRGRAGDDRDGCRMTGKRSGRARGCDETVIIV